MTDSNDPLTGPKTADRLPAGSTAMRPAPTRETRRWAIRQTRGARLWFKALGPEPRRDAKGNTLAGYRDEWTADGSEAADLSKGEAKLYRRESRGPDWKNVKIVPHPEWSDGMSRNKY